MNRKALDRWIEQTEGYVFQFTPGPSAVAELHKLLVAAKRDSDRLDFMLANGWALTAWAERFGAKRSGIDAAMAAEKKGGKR